MNILCLGDVVGQAGCDCVRSKLPGLKAQYQVDVDKRKISIDGEIKAFGSYSCEVKLYAGITAKVYVMVGEDN